MKKKINYGYKKHYFFIYLSLLILFFWEKKLKNGLKIKENEIDKGLYSNEIIYKGEKIQKYKLINNYLSEISDDHFVEKEEEKIRFNKYYNLAVYSNKPKIKYKLRDKFLKEISKIKNRNITKLDVFFLKYCINFGNNLLTINNAIFYCELVGCHKVILNRDNHNRRWLIIKPIFNEKTNITIMQGSKVNCKNDNILCLYEISWWVFFPKIVIPQIRIDLMKKEILRNLPFVKINPDDLYIHIRGGDIFKNFIARFYSQPPLCFYEKIINTNFFKNIFIISKDNSNIVTNALLNKYKSIIFRRNNFEYDISLLCHAFNIALSVSSFSLAATKLNENLENIWEYDIMRLSEKLLLFHHHIYNLNNRFNIYTMKPSKIYRSKMFTWKKTPEQIELMIKDKCPYDFTLTKPNI